MIIHIPEIKHLNGEVILQARVETQSSFPNFPNVLWFKYPERYREFISGRSDAFLCALIRVAQSMGENIECKGDISPRLLYALDEYQDIYKFWYPDVFRQTIQVQVDRISHPAPPFREKQYALTFSGGVDSFFNLYNTYILRDNNPVWDIRYGLFIHGSPDIPLKFTSKYETLRLEYQQMFDELGLELIPVSTNIMQFSGRRILFKQFLNAPLVSSALGLSSLLSGLFIGSSETFTQFNLKGNGLLTTHLQSTETLEFFETGSGYKRIDHIKAIADWEYAQHHLRVCFGFNSETIATNCSNCGKCLRTRMALHALGRLESFSTFRSSIKFRDYWLWGRWLEVGWRHEIDTLKYAWQYRKKMVLPLLIGILIGYFRHLLRICLPGWLLKRIIKTVSPDDPYELFV